MSANVSISEIEQETGQIGRPFEVASIARDEVEIICHDLVEIVETETPRALEGLLAEGLLYLRRDGSEHVDPKLLEADVDDPCQQPTGDRADVVVAVEPA